LSVPIRSWLIIVHLARQLRRWEYWPVAKTLLARGKAVMRMFMHIFKAVQLLVLWSAH